MRLFFLGPRFFGIRPGISLGREDLRPSRGAQAPIEGSFLYLIVGPPGRIKVGVTTDPRQRLAALQTGSPYPLKFAAILATPGDGYDLEAHVHSLLEPHRVSGEWFRTHPVKALIAMRQAADALQEPVLGVSLERAEEILAIARNAPVGPARSPWVHGWRLPIIAGVLVFFLVFTWLSRLH